MLDLSNAPLKELIGLGFFNSASVHVILPRPSGGKEYIGSVLPPPPPPPRLFHSAQCFYVILDQLPIMHNTFLMTRINSANFLRTA